MNNLFRLKSLFEKVSNCDSNAEWQKLTDAHATNPSPMVLSFLNAHAVNLACVDPSFFNDLLKANILLRDGVGLEIGLSLIGREPGLNLNGTDLIPQIIKRYDCQDIVLMGTKEPYLSRAKSYIERTVNSRVVACVDGYREKDHYRGVIQRHKPSLVVLGMGMPKQEQIASYLQDNVDGPMLLINGGAILDFWANRVRRAPNWIQLIRLEWLYRLLQEPSRLWKRYLVGNPLFLLRVVGLRILDGRFSEETPCHSP